MRFRFALIFASFALFSCSNTSQETVTPPASHAAETAARRTSTYRLLQQETATAFELSSKPTIYVLGETHLGKGQIDVARIATEAFKEHEIDAVFVEQPDTLKFDWSPYQRLQGSRDAAIA